MSLDAKLLHAVSQGARIHLEKLSGSIAGFYSPPHFQDRCQDVLPSCFHKAPG